MASKVYIAGVGYAPSPSEGPSKKAIVSSLVSAATKALLDAGVTYDDVTHGVSSSKSNKLRYGPEAFKAFDKGAIKVNEVKSGSELESSISLIKDKGVQCVLAITVDYSATIAFVLISERFLWRHPYLKDSAALICESDAKSKGEAGKGLFDVCQMIWSLRGWSNPQKTAGEEGRLYYRSQSNKSFELSRADAKDAPDWKDIEHKQDGRDRLGYNPASKTKDISQEDFDAVRPVSRRGNDGSRFERKGGDRAALAKL